MSLWKKGFTYKINAEDVEKVREIQTLGERRGTTTMVEAVVVASLTTEMISDDGLLTAFNGCSAVFHTASFVDPAGVSGYSVSGSTYS